MTKDAGLARLGVWAVLARIGIGLFLLIALILFAASCYLSWREFGETTSMFRFAHPGIAIWLILGFIPAALPTLVWIHRAHANLRDDGDSDLVYSPGWSAGSYFVPGVNLVVPLRAMRELWNRSHGEEPWFAQNSVETVASWWTCLIAGSTIQLYLTAIAVLQIATRFRVTTPPGVDLGFGALSILLLAGSAIFLFRIITRITRAQHEVTRVGNTFA